MIQRCCLCGTIYGHKAPFLDTNETTGICGECYIPYFKKLRKQMEEYYAGRVRDLRGLKRTSQVVDQK